MSGLAFLPSIAGVLGIPVRDDRVSVFIVLFVSVLVSGWPFSSPVVDVKGIPAPDRLASVLIVLSFPGVLCQVGLLPPLIVHVKVVPAPDGLVSILLVLLSLMACIRLACLLSQSEQGCQ